ncbi:YagK/YfjJ domain-containing protein [Burkholderia anthina]|uniref:YagK/YfjJ domain-containing protein n=1 Tax=Burkholderia anthina TaxID=179879 RepID=UPI00158E4B52|nr:inovirus-type Gp2 protein [Burkholderia anthina]
MNSSINLHVVKSKDVNYILPYFMDGIVDLMKFMNMVIYEDLLFYQDLVSASGVSRKRISPLGAHIERLHSYGHLYLSGYTFSPLIAFFFEQYRKHPIKDSALLLDKIDPEGLDSNLFNDFVMTMRREAVVTKLKKRVSDWNGKFKESRSRIVEFEAELFNRYARLMAIRLDFNYHKAIFTADEVAELCAEAVKQKEHDVNDYLAGSDISAPSIIEGRIALEEVQNDRKRFFANMKGKPSLFRHLVGYVWRIEYTRGAGYHMHVLLFFDGAHVQNHEHYAQEIGCYWRDVITKGRGYFENCNRKKSSYGDNWALGQIDHWDWRRREKLRKAMQYFTKTSQIVQVVPYAKCRLFQSVFTRRQRRAAGGRPRMRRAVGDNQGAAC